MTKVFITSTNCSWNKGSAAQVISTMEILAKYFNKIEFILSSQYPNLDKKEAQKNNYNIKIVDFIKQVDNSNSYKQYMYIKLQIISRLIQCIKYKIFKSLKINNEYISRNDWLKELAECDIVINLSGDSFSDGKGGNILWSGLEALCCIVLKKPLVFFSQSIGPFRKRNMLLAKYCLNKAKIIIVREEISKEYLDNLNIKSPIYITADCAFILKPANYERIKNILEEEQVSIKKNPLIGVSTNVLFDRENEMYSQEMAQLIDVIIEKFDAQIMIIPHVISPFKDGSNDDRAAGVKIFEQCRNKDNIILIKGEYSPQELKGLIGLTDAFIGGRMHANIAALSSAIPTIAIAWSHKYYGIMSAVGQEQYAFNFKYMKLEVLLPILESLLKNGEFIKNELSIQIKNQEKLAWYSGELVDSTVSDIMK